jgi:hypothetical protein
VGAHYDRGVALVDLGKTDDAVAEFKSVEGLASGKNRRPQSVALWGIADAYGRAGRCDDARPAYEAYARFMEQEDKAGAEMARRYASSCVSPARP